MRKRLTHQRMRRVLAFTAAGLVAGASIAANWRPSAQVSSTFSPFFLANDWRYETTHWAVHGWPWSFVLQKRSDGLFDRQSPNAQYYRVSDPTVHYERMAWHKLGYNIAFGLLITICTYCVISQFARGWRAWRYSILHLLIATAGVAILLVWPWWDYHIPRFLGMPYCLSAVLLAGLACTFLAVVSLLSHCCQAIFRWAT